MGFQSDFPQAISGNSMWKAVSTYQRLYGQQYIIISPTFILYSSIYLDLSRVTNVVVNICVYSGTSIL